MAEGFLKLISADRADALHSKLPHGPPGVLPLGTATLADAILERLVQSPSRLRVIHAGPVLVGCHIPTP